ncbi:MAG: hypothetical protein ACE5JI_12930, partial [Acidobacteriota bacterium]
GGGACKTIDQSSTLYIDPDTITPGVADPTQAYSEGMILWALETEDCNGDGQLGIYPFEVTQPPKMTSTGGEDTLQINHNPGKSESGLNPPGGFNRQVHPDCTVIGLFRVVQYRINPLPPTPNPVLERRDLSDPLSPLDWIPVAHNIENLQVQYALGSNPNFVDEPPGPPLPSDPTTWITQVKVTVAGRSESTNLQGASAGVFAPEDTHLRRTFSTVVSLRNQVNAASRLDATYYQ